MGKSAMKHALVFAALAFAAAPALAEIKACDIDSDYDVALSPEAITSSRDDGTPRTLVMHAGSLRSEEHTSELQSLMSNSYAVFCLKKKQLATKCHYNQTTRHNIY